MSRRVSSLLAVSTCLWGLAQAVNIPFSSVPKPGAGDARFSLNAVKDADDAFDFNNLNDIVNSDIYVATLTINGKDFVVQMDTGSSDLWIDTSGVNLNNLTNTNLQSGITYGDGTVAAGPILIGPVKFGEFTVNQAFISAPGSNATTNGDKGLLGVGPPLLSAISNALSGTQFDGETLLENIFQANTSEPNLITFFLSRSTATGSTDGGVFTVGEVNSTMSGISSAPKLPVVSRNRWIALMDGMIVNGKQINGGSAFSGVQGQTTGQTLANLDTGTSLSQIPKSYVDAIYEDVPGAQYFASQGVYVLPCDAKINVSFVFGGQEFPVHPIDTVVATLDDNNNVMCFSGFPASSGASNSEDLLLGDSFLRNVYSLYDFGTFTNATNSPFMQLLSTTNQAQAFSEFDSLSQQRNASLTGSNAKQSPSGNGGQNGAPSLLSPSAMHLSLASAAAVCFGFLVL